ncbi:MAG: hypothetical protein AAGC47_11110 [Bacteroidota bacterium]
MNRLLFLVLFGFTLVSCHEKDSQESQSKSYPEHLGQISYDPLIDDIAFQLCDTSMLVQSRLVIAYEGTNKALEEECRKHLNLSENRMNYDGYIMARFLINCRKETGRIRLQTLDAQFLEQDCPAELKEEIRRCVLSLNKWIFTRPNNQGKDHSKFLNFKFSNGELQTIIH